MPVGKRDHARMIEKAGRMVRTHTVSNVFHALRTQFPGASADECDEAIEMAGDVKSIAPDTWDLTGTTPSQ